MILLRRKILLVTINCLTQTSCSTSFKFNPNLKPTCEAPITSSSSKVIEFSSPLPRKDILITRSLKQPINLSINRFNISEVRDQHLAGCAGESQGMPWTGTNCLGGFEKAQIIISKLALNTDLLNNPELKPEYDIKLIYY